MPPVRPCAPVSDEAHDEEIDLVTDLEAYADEFAPTDISEVLRLGSYQLLYEIGSGGMANVYLACHTPTGRPVAIKRIHPHLAASERFVLMFLDEARIASSLDHPNVARVLELGEDRGEHFLAMEYLHGEHLGQLVAQQIRRRRAPLEPHLGAFIASEVACGLHHAHEARDALGAPLDLVHRDVTPGNIFVGYDGSVKLTDFGIAKARHRITQTQTGSVKGKLAYMSPEQALAHPIDRRTDVFALGVCLWETTVGQRLFKGDNEAQTVLRLTSGKVPPPSTRRAGYPPALERIVMRALAHDPANRHATALELAEDLGGYLSTAPAAGAPELAERMRALFVDRAQVHRRLLTDPGRRAEEIAVAAGSPPTETRGTADLDPPSSRPRWPWVAAAVVMAGLAAGAALALWPASGYPVRVVTEPPGATVTLNGSPVGVTPLDLEDVAPGEHSATVTLEGHRAVETMIRVRDAPVSLRYTLVEARSPRLNRR